MCVPSKIMLSESSHIKCHCSLYNGEGHSSRAASNKAFTYHVHLTISACIMGHILIPVHNISLLDSFTVQLIRQHHEIMFFMKL
jgi:hypothetical protein